VNLRIAIASGKGGTGKTTIATNLAAALAHKQWPVTYVDCDVEEPNGHLFLRLAKEQRRDVTVLVPVVDQVRCSLCGDCSRVCEFNAVAVLGTRTMIFPSLCHSCGACVELCPEHALREVPRVIGFIRSGTMGRLRFFGGCLNVGESLAPPVTRAVKRLIPTEGVTIIDAPPGTSCPVVEAVRDTDFVVLVTEPTPFGLNDLRLAVEMLHKLRQPFGVAINRADSESSLVEDYCQTEQLPILLRLPFDRRIAERYATGDLIVETDGTFRASMLRLFSRIQEAINERTRRSQR
jgi:MinD superfamily P-loop ATPase